MLCNFVSNFSQKMFSKFLLSIFSTLFLLILLLLLHLATIAFAKSAHFAVGFKSFRIVCDSDRDCPENAICTSNKCICSFGFAWIDRARCAPVTCTADRLDCEQRFAYSRCDTESHRCVCIGTARLNHPMQQCVDWIDPAVLWFGFVTIACITVFVPLGAAVCAARRRRLKIAKFAKSPNNNNNNDNNNKIDISGSRKTHVASDRQAAVLRTL